MIRVAIQPAEAGGCGWYRLFQPMLALRERREVELACSLIYRAPDGQMHVEPVGDKPFEVIRKASGYGKFVLTEDEIITADVVVVQKAGGRKVLEAEMSLLDTIKRFSRKFVYEMDDDVWTIPKSNPCWREEVQYSQGGAERMKQLVAASGTVTVTTPYLAGVAGRYSRNVRVVPNGIDFALWRPDGWAPPYAAPRAEVRVGYVASRHHVEDMAILVKPWKKLAAAFPHVTFVLAGTFDAELKSALGDRLEVYPDGVPVDVYPEWCRALRLDVCVGPLVDSVFARSKSNLKWLEATALGCPFVCSAVEPYARDAGLGPVLVRGGGAKQWTDALGGMILNADLRRMTVETSEREIGERYTAAKSADAWLSVISTVAASFESAAA